MPTRRGRIRKALKRQLNETVRHKKDVDSVLHVIDRKRRRLQEIHDHMEHFECTNLGVITKGKDMDLNKTTGVWIVTKREENKVEMKKFFEFIRDVKHEFTLLMNLPKFRVGRDGKEVTFNKGDLLVIGYLGDLEEKGKGFHFANVGPNDELGQLQYELALYKLGMGLAPKTDKSFLVVDGSFRQVQ